MLNNYLKTRTSSAKRLVKELSKEYDYVSVLGSVVHNKMINVSTHVNSIDDADTECGFVIKVYKDGRYSEYSCNDIKELKAKDVIKAVKLKKIVSADFKVKMIEEEALTKDYLREDKSKLSDDEIVKTLKGVKEKLEKQDSRMRQTAKSHEAQRRPA